jgi:transposase
MLTACRCGDNALKAPYLRRSAVERSPPPPAPPLSVRLRLDSVPNEVGSVGDRKRIIVTLPNTPGEQGVRPKRRTFTAEYKLRIVAEYDAAKVAGEGVAILRRGGLYHSQILEWRAARDAGALTVLGVRKTPTGESRRRSADAAEVERLRRRNERLEVDLARTRTALGIMGSAHALWETLSGGADDTTSGPPPRRR